MHVSSALMQQFVEKDALTWESHLQPLFIVKGHFEIDAIINVCIIS